METIELTCPTCFQRFEITAPPEAELPARFDYDCEVCCRPMEVCVEASEEGELFAEAIDPGR